MSFIVDQYGKENAMCTLNRCLAIIGLSAVAFIGLLPGQSTADPQQTAPKALSAQPVDKAEWAGKLAALKDADWRKAFSVGNELAELPTDEGFAILKANWDQIEKVEARQQILKSWNFAMPYPLHARNHPRLLDVLDLGMRDRSPEVQKWALSFLRGVALQDFAEDFAAYKKWYSAAQGQPVVKVVSDSVRQFVKELAQADGKEAASRADLVVRESTFRDVPEARQSALEAGIIKIVERWIAESLGPKADQATLDLAANGLKLLTQLRAGEEDVRRIVVPLLEKGTPFKVRAAAVEAVGRKELPWSVDLVIKVLEECMDEGKPAKSTDLWGVARTLADLEDPKAIPVMIAAIDADNTYATIYGVGYFGLSRLTGVKYDEAHDGAWWRKWWEKSREKYPASVRDMTIPQFTKRTGTNGSVAKAAAEDVDVEDALADVKDVPAQDLRIAGDDKKRFFLIGKVEPKESDAAPRSLLVILPGGDGSADFHPFIRRILKNVLPKDWLIAQLVAPKWDDRQFAKVVWPTAGLAYPGARFTTEEFIESAIAAVDSRTKIDAKRIFLLGWSSGGPACYAAALRPKTPVTGAFIAMSVFRPEQMPNLENAKGRAFYLLQSPADKVTPIAFATVAERTLAAAGAAARLEKYPGGHGWQGDVWKMISDGIRWLEKPAAGNTTAAAAPISDPGLEEAGVATPAAESTWSFMEAPIGSGYRVSSETHRVFAGKRCALLQRDGKSESVAFGNLMQVVDAVPYRGKRIRFRAAVRSNVEGEGNQAMLWTRVDRPEQKDKTAVGFFDNMSDRPIKTNDWRHYDIVGDIHDDAVTINVGLVLVGSGKAWIDDVSLEIVGTDVPVTGTKS